MPSFKGFGKPPEGQHTLWHYTLNTANTFDCRAKKFSPHTLTLLGPIARRALLEEQTSLSLPEPLERFRVKVTAAAGGALFDIYGAKNIILTTNALAWTEDGAEQIWERFENLYLRLSGEFRTTRISRAPEQPGQLPWLATYVLPNPEIAGLSWLSDFEQCLALALISAARSPD